MVDYNETVREIQLRYVGRRFDRARMPVEVLPDLPAFRDLLTALVKDGWRRDNTKKQRLPKGFDRSFTFDLAGVREGSAIPVIEWNRDVAQENLPGMADYLETLAHDAMVGLLEIVDGAGNGRLPRSLPADAIRALNKFGSSLREGERIEFQGSRGEDTNVVFLDAERRKRLITHVKETYDVRVEGVGKLHGTSMSGSIEIETTYGLINIPVEPDEVSGIYDGSIGSIVQFDLTLELDHNEKFRAVRLVHEIDLVEEANAAAISALVNRIQELEELEDGWLDGEGSKIPAKAIELSKEFILRCLLQVPIMRAYPSLDGGITLQMRSDNHSASVDFDADGNVDLTVIGISDSFEFNETYEGVGADLIAKVYDLFHPGH